MSSVGIFHKKCEAKILSLSEELNVERDNIQSVEVEKGKLDQKLSSANDQIRELASKLQSNAELLDKQGKNLKKYLRVIQTMVETQETDSVIRSMAPELIDFKQRVEVKIHLSISPMVLPQLVEGDNLQRASGVLNSFPGEIDLCFQNDIQVLEPISLEGLKLSCRVLIGVRLDVATQYLLKCANNLVKRYRFGELSPRIDFSGPVEEKPGMLVRIVLGSTGF